MPVILTGDFNERDGRFCRLTATGHLRAAAGGANRTGECRPPAFEWHRLDLRQPPAELDTVDRRPLPGGQRTSDHPLVYATATL